MEAGGVTLTWILIAALTNAFGLSLGGWIYTSHQANCEHRSRVFAQAQIEQHTQGPINECER